MFVTKLTSYTYADGQCGAGGWRLLANRAGRRVGSSSQANIGRALGCLANRAERGGQEERAVK